MLKKHYRLTIVCALLSTLLLAGPVFATIANSHTNYNRLMDFILHKDLEKPLLLVDNESGEFDRRLNKENLTYLNNNKGLLEKIQTRLEAQTLKWKLAGSSKRLLVVPESRQEYAELFEGYCKEAVAYALDRTQLPNPYSRIATFQEPMSLRDSKTDDGITAYLVHNIADEYVEEYLFFNQDNAKSKIKIKLSNRVFTGKIGSYTSKLTIGENYHIDFVREPFTLWQNSAKNPINVLVAPVEETLHIALRTATEAAIREKLQTVKPTSLEGVQEVVDDWMAVEEAIVGGLVARLMPEIFSRLLDGPLEKEMSESLSERDSHEQYRYLQNGIRVVSDLGLEEAVALYTSKPGQFRKMVAPADLAAAEHL